MINIIIAVVALFALAALLSTALIEIIRASRGVRRYYLFKALTDLLDPSTTSRHCPPGNRTDPGPVQQQQQLDAHRRAAIRCTRIILTRYRRLRALRDKPDFIAPPMFAAIMMSIRDQWPPMVAQHITEIANTRPDQELSTIIAAWFEQSMTEVSRSWRRRTRISLFVAGLVLAILLNLNVQRVVTYAQQNPDDVVAAALMITESQPGGSTTNQTELPQDLVQTLKQLGQHGGITDFILYPSAMSDPEPTAPTTPPEGASAEPVQADQINALGQYFRGLGSALLSVEHWLSWLVVALGASVGAPFWLDFLRQLLRLRPSSKPDTQPSEAQLSADAATTHDQPTADDPAAQQTLSEISPADAARQHALAALRNYPQQRELCLAYLSDLCYLSPRVVAQTLATVPIAHAWVNDVGADTQCLIVRINNHIIVAMRGTAPSLSNIADVVTDGRAFPVAPHWVQKPIASGYPAFDCPSTQATEWYQKIPGMAKILNWWWLDSNYYKASNSPTTLAVHAGFNEALIDSTWTEIRQTIHALQQDSGPAEPQQTWTISFTGHSLGGALATLAAAHFLGDAAQQTVSFSPAPAVHPVSANHDRSQPPLHFGGVVTFGQPMVGNASFNTWFADVLQHARDQGQITTPAQGALNQRFVHGLDPVAHLPIASLCHMPSDMVERVARGDGLSAGFSPLSLLTDAFGDHAMDGYLTVADNT